MTFALRLIGSIQIILGLAYLLAPGQFLLGMGHSPLPPDLAYPLGMLAARFLAYGAGLWLVSRQVADNRLWIRLMGVIQLIDLGVGLAYTLGGTVQWSHSGFPMFNAVWIAGLCLWIAAHRDSSTSTGSA